MKRFLLILAVILAPAVSQAQKIYQYERDDLRLLFFDERISQYVPYIVKEYTLGAARHEQIWGSYNSEQTYVYLTDWNDDGNGGATPIPNKFVMVGMAPLRNNYDVAPSVERYRHLFDHELTHLAATDKSIRKDDAWRKFMGSKVATDSDSPITALWSYFTTPRWYAPRWYHEGIACFIETAFGGGVGRALGTYDEMYFRTLVDNKQRVYSAVGLETEGTSEDFQVGAASYLYGTRFVNYLALKHGPDSLISLYNRTDDSKRFFSSQFRKVYGKRLIDEWEDWRQYEAAHQEENLKQIQQYPLTNLVPLYKEAMGSVCPPILDPERERLYLATYDQGSIPHISYIDLKTGKEHRLHKIDGPSLYITSFIAFDQKRNRLFYTIHNSDLRGLYVIDGDTGKRLQRLEFQRAADLVYDNTNDCLWAVLSNSGIHHIIKYNSDLSQREICYSFNFGQSISGLTVSHSGKQLVANLIKPNGNNELISFSIDENTVLSSSYESVMEIDNVNLVNFRFSDDDSMLLGSSNYTGVQNIWAIDMATKEMKLLSNVKTGLFAPLSYKKDSLLALSYEAKGMRPVKLAFKEIHDANSVDLLGQKVYMKYPELQQIDVLEDTAQVTYKEVYNQIKEYKSFKELRFAGGYPDISGFRDRQAFNNVTPVLGYRFNIKDPVGINSLEFNVGISPWSNNPWNERIHADLTWTYWSWKLRASYNPTNFYDLFGPRRSSRSGYQFGLSYSRRFNLLAPMSLSWSASVNTYGMMDELPLFQEIQSPVTSMQTASANVSLSKVHSSLGAVAAESGYKTSFSAYSYFASFNGKYMAFPSAQFQFDKGFRLPFGGSNSLWLRSAFGQSFGDSNSAFGNSYFGGFRNNYVDNGQMLRYRDVEAFPGARIDQISAHSFAKISSEILFSPIRFRNIGAPGFYPTYGLFSIFGGNLMANPWGKAPFSDYWNIGAQFNLELVFFSYLKTTLSAGYAYMFGPSGLRQGEFMISLKLL